MIKKMFNVFVFVVLCATVPCSVSWAGRGLHSGDQTIYGSKTFEHDATFTRNVTINGALLGVAQYSNVFYVDSGSGHDSAGNYGESYLKPFATIEYAIGQCTASNGDVIYLMPGHNEGITTAANIDLDVIGISVIGLGSGSLKPTIDYDAAAASVAIGADNCTIKNVRFRTSFNAVVVGLNVEDDADYARIIDCEFGWAETATDEFAIALQTGDASNHALVEGCTFMAGAQAAVTAIKFTEDTDGTVVRNNWITGSYSTAPVLGITTASTNLLITGNQIFTAGTTDTFNLVAASTGIVSDNYITMNAASAAAALDIGNCLSIEHYLIADNDVGGAAAAITASAFASVTATADD